VLVHPRPALDSELFRTLVELLLGIPAGVDAAVRRLALARPTALGAGVGRAFLVLLDPAIALALERVLQGGVRGAVRSLALAVRLDGAVVRLGPGALRLARRTTDRARHLLCCRHPSHLARI